MKGITLGWKKSRSRLLAVILASGIAVCGYAEKDIYGFIRVAGPNSYCPDDLKYKDNYSSYSKTFDRARAACAQPINHEILPYTDKYGFRFMGTYDTNGNPLVWATNVFDASAPGFIATDKVISAEYPWGGGAEPTKTLPALPRMVNRKMTGDPDLAASVVTKDRISLGQTNGNPKYDLCSALTNGQMRLPTMEEWDELLKIRNLKVTFTKRPNRDKNPLANGQWQCVSPRDLFGTPNNSAVILGFRGSKTEGVVQVTAMVESRVKPIGLYNYTADLQKGIVTIKGREYKYTSRTLTDLTSGDVFYYQSDGTNGDFQLYTYTLEPGVMPGGRGILYKGLPMTFLSKFNKIRNAQDAKAAKFDPPHVAFWTGSWGYNNGVPMPLLVWIDEDGVEVRKASPNMQASILPVKAIQFPVYTVLVNKGECRLKIKADPRVRESNNKADGVVPGKNQVVMVELGEPYCYNIDNDTISTSLEVLPASSIIVGHITDKRKVDSGDGWKDYELDYEWEYIVTPDGRTYPLSDTGERDESDPTCVYLSIAEDYELEYDMKYGHWRTIKPSY